MSIFTRSRHLDRGAIGLYVLRDLSASHVSPVERHLANCAHCQSDLKVMRELVAALRAARRIVPHKPNAL